jgi:Tetratricopeptide repeat
MADRSRCVWLVCVWLGWATLPALAAEEPSPARRLWEQGQAAMQAGRTADAVRCYEQSLAADPAFARAHLSLAAAYLEQGEEVRACPHLARYLAAQPGHLMVRVHYAELLRRLGRTHEARAEFLRFVADCPADTEDQLKQLVHCHSRLMEIAEEEANRYDEHLHRGVGLFLLARQRIPLGDDGELPAEGLLCKAAAELTLARIERPGEAQPNWYLYEVWSRLDQRRPAQRALHAADEAAPFSYLTTSEQNNLQLARQRLRGPSLAK